MSNPAFFAALHAIANLHLSAEQARDLAQAAMRISPEEHLDTCLQMRLMCSACGGTGEVTRPDGEYMGTCDCSYANDNAPTLQPGQMVNALVKKWEVTAQRFAKRATTISMAEAASMSNCADELRTALAVDRKAITGADTDDAIARSKRILAMVDNYCDSPTSDNRSILRCALMHEFDRNLTSAQLENIARKSGLWAHLSSLGATDARHVIAEFTAALPAHIGKYKDSTSDDFILVPQTPTQEMEEAGDAAYAQWENGHCVLAIWEAMVNVVKAGKSVR